MRPPSKQPPLPPKAIYGQLQALLGARRKRTVAELRRAGVPTRDAAGVLAAESAAIRKLGIDLARHGVLQAVRQSPVFSAPVPGNAQGLFKSAVDLWVADTEKLFVSSSADLVREANALVLAGRASGKTNAEIGAEIVLKATKVDGVYTADPKKDSSATRYTKLSFDEAIARNLGIMDATAFALCRDQKLPVKVFSIFKHGGLERVVMGEDEGTLVYA